jgi:hypothetical protein
MNHLGMHEDSSTAALAESRELTAESCLRFPIASIGKLIVLGVGLERTSAIPEMLYPGRAQVFDKDSELACADAHVGELASWQILGTPSVESL